MASLTAIRDAVKTTLEAAIPSLHVFPRIPDDTGGQPVAAVLLPATADFAQAMGRGVDTWVFDLLVLVPIGDPDVGQATLDEYVTGAGPKSIRQAVFTARSLGLDQVDAHVQAMTAYNVAFVAAGFDHLGGSLRLVVHTKGTA